MVLEVSLLRRRSGGLSANGSTERTQTLEFARIQVTSTNREETHQQGSEKKGR